MHGVARLRQLAPGVLLAAAGAALAYAAHGLWPAVPALSFAVVLGVLVANVPGLRGVAAGPVRPGLGFSARTLLRAGIVLLGLELSLGSLARLGAWGLLLTAGVVAAAFAGTYLLGRAFRLEGDQPLLLAAGFSICGVSAIGAVAAARGSKPQDVAAPVALVTLCGSLAIAVLPAVMAAAQLPPDVFGVWAGSSVHDVGQVVATAQSAGTAALAAAVVVKLARVLMLAPIAAGVAWQRRSTSATG
ncbi:membrane protein, partial [Arthrobacter crystallopoietes BAB-32]